MTDEEYILRQTNKERAVTARSSYKKRTHCGKPGCRLPHEAMSRKEINSMNGPEYTLNLNRPMKNDEFKELPKNLQKQFIEHLRTTYKASIGDIAKMLDVGTSTAHRILKSLGVEVNDKRPLRKGNKEAFEWRQFLAGEFSQKIFYMKDEEISPLIADEPEKSDGPEEDKFDVEDISEKPEKTILTANLVAADSGSLTYIGDVRSLFMTLVYAISSELRTKIAVTFSTKDETDANNYISGGQLTFRRATWKNVCDVLYSLLPDSITYQFYISWTEECYDAIQAEAR